ncbi:MAG: hypothetical protein A2Y15_04490 [Clostridiales bacterium GWF2_36_10]|nr:MAG: hypothetical protein A2Y15_04490 [Clostridiales bacterium GWF2_36_10]HAN20670.1 hypothetical protein [Clostridiales bacterium]
MNIKKYISTSDNELKSILLELKSTANNLMISISNLKNNTSGHAFRNERDAIISKYATLKTQLKEIYHYINLEKNEDLSNSFYSCYFCPAVTDCYIHCDAKANGTDLEKLYSSLYDIDDYINYYLLKNKT